MASNGKKRTLKNVFADRLREERARKGLSQEALAEKAEVSVSYVSMLERGQRSPPLETVELFEDALGVKRLALLTARVG